MCLDQICLRVMLFALGVTAMAGVAIIFTHENQVLWRLVETGAATTVAAALTWPLTSESEGLIGVGALTALKPGALLINVARGKVVDEAALLAALADGRVRAAALDCFPEEPLPAQSAFWALPKRSRNKRAYCTVKLMGVVCVVALVPLALMV